VGSRSSAGAVARELLTPEAAGPFGHAVFLPWHGCLGRPNPSKTTTDRRTLWQTGSARGWSAVRVMNAWAKTWSANVRPRSGGRSSWTLH